MESISTGLLFEVLRARLAAGADIVIKRPVPAHTDSKRVRALLVREAEACAALGGMGAPFMLGWDAASGELSRSWIQGKTLAELRAERGAASAPIALAVLYKLLEVVARVHAAGWLVVDLSPSNVLLTASGDLVILDFGSARRLESAAAKAESELDPVSPGFTSPEQVASLPLGTASDLYSAARVAQWLVTGESGRAPHPVVPGSDLSPGMSRALLRVGDLRARGFLRRCLSRVEQERPVHLDVEMKACRSALGLRGVPDLGVFLADATKNWRRSWGSALVLYVAFSVLFVAVFALMLLLGARAERVPNHVESAWIDVSASPWATCTVDGSAPTVTPAGAPWRVAPGKHTVRCEHPFARPEEQRVVARAAEHAHVFVRMNVPDQDRLSPESLTAAYLKEATP